jgi:hypothetical protein
MTKLITLTALLIASSAHAEQTGGNASTSLLLGVRSWHRHRPDDWALRLHLAPPPLGMMAMPLTETLICWTKYF